MPLYEYECQQCSNVTEVLQRFSDPPLTVCSECDGELKKLISSPAIQFKGSGFYITDYKKSGSNGSKSESSSKSESGPGSTSSTSNASNTSSKSEK